MEVACLVQHRGLLRSQVQVGFQLVRGTRAQDRRSHARSVCDPRQSHLSHRDTPILSHLLYGIDDVPRAVRTAAVVRLHAAARILPEPSAPGWALVTPVLTRQ